MHFLRFCACHENTSNLVPKSSWKAAPGPPKHLKNVIEKQCKKRYRFLMIFGRLWEPRGSHLGAIWGPKWLLKRTLGPHGTPKPCQMTPKPPLWPPRGGFASNFAPILGTFCNIMLLSTLEWHSQYGYLAKSCFSVPRSGTLSMVLRSCLRPTEKPGNPTPARGSSKNEASQYLGMALSAWY